MRSIISLLSLSLLVLVGCPDKAETPAAADLAKEAAAAVADEAKKAAAGAADEAAGGVDEAMDAAADAMKEAGKEAMAAAAAIDPNLPGGVDHIHSVVCGCSLGGSCGNMVKVGEKYLPLGGELDLGGMAFCGKGTELTARIEGEVKEGVFVATSFQMMEDGEPTDAPADPHAH